MDLIKTDRKEVALDRCQLRIWETQKELESYSVLFSALSRGEFSGESLYGVGIHLKRMSRRLDKVNNTLRKLIKR